jgi:hypothetical protein
MDCPDYSLTRVFPINGSSAASAVDRGAFNGADRQVSGAQRAADSSPPSEPPPSSTTTTRRVAIAFELPDGRSGRAELGEGEVLELDDLALRLEKRQAGHRSLRDEISALERARMLEALEACGGNQSRAALLIGMPRRTFVVRLSQYGITRPRRARRADDGAEAVSAEPAE